MHCVYKKNGEELHTFDDKGKLKEVYILSEKWNANTAKKEGKVHMTYKDLLESIDYLLNENLLSYLKHMRSDEMVEGFIKGMFLGVKQVLEANLKNPTVKEEFVDEAIKCIDEELSSNFINGLSDDLYKKRLNIIKQKVETIKEG